MLGCIERERERGRDMLEYFERGRNRERKRS